VLHRADQDVAWWLEAAGGATRSDHAGAAVLELACGTGRLTHALAGAGLAVVGLDNDQVMLAAAAHRPRRTWPIFVAGDMRRFALHHRFALVFVGYNSLQLLTTPSEMTACLRLAREHLVPGGRVGVEVSDFQIGGADDPHNEPDAHDAPDNHDNVGNPELLGDAEGIRLAGSLVHDLGARTSRYRRHFSGEGWTVADEIVVRSLDRPELEGLFRAAGLTGVKWWVDGATVRALAAP
jgi:SAM-dependent methyltransferase